jgi:hypothetical protein
MMMRHSELWMALFGSVLQDILTSTSFRTRDLG